MKKCKSHMVYRCGFSSGHQTSFSLFIPGWLVLLLQVKTQIHKILYMEYCFCDNCTFLHIHFYIHTRNDRKWLFMFPFPLIPIQSIPIPSHSHSQFCNQFPFPWDFHWAIPIPFHSHSQTIINFNRCSTTFLADEKIQA